MSAFTAAIQDEKYFTCNVGGFKATNLSVELVNDAIVVNGDSKGNEQFERRVVVPSGIEKGSITYELDIRKGQLRIVAQQLGASSGGGAQPRLLLDREITVMADPDPAEDNGEPVEASVDEE